MEFFVFFGKKKKYFAKEAQEAKNFVSLQITDEHVSGCASRSCGTSCEKLSRLKRRGTDSRAARSDSLAPIHNVLFTNSDSLARFSMNVKTRRDAVKSKATSERLPVKPRRLEAAARC